MDDDDDGDVLMIIIVSELLSTLCRQRSEAEREHGSGALQRGQDAGNSRFFLHLLLDMEPDLLSHVLPGLRAPDRLPVLAVYLCWHMFYLDYPLIDFTSAFYNFTVIMVFLNCCVNPVIYSIKYEQVRSSYSVHSA